MKKIATLSRSALAVAAAVSGAALTAPATALAEDDSPISANVALTTDYVWRGISQTLGEPALQGGFDYSHPIGFYAGVWGSSVDFGGPEHLELDYYAGYGSEIKGLGYDFGVIWYDYYDDTDTDFGEIYGSLSYDFGTFGIEAGGNYTDGFANSDANEYYVFAGVAVPLGHVFSGAAKVGYTDIEELGEWMHWQIGIGAAYFGAEFDLSYHGSDDKAAAVFPGENPTDDQLVFTVSKSF